MNQSEEFTKYFYHQVHGEENQVFLEEPKEEINLEEEEDNKTNMKQSDSSKKYEQGKDTSNRLNNTNKRYRTYSLEYKKEIIQEVKNKNNNYL